MPLGKAINSGPKNEKELSSAASLLFFTTFENSFMGIELGHISAIFRYPIKSMAGERLDSANGNKTLTRKWDIVHYAPVFNGDSCFLATPNRAFRQTKPAAAMTAAGRS